MHKYNIFRYLICWIRQKLWFSSFFFPHPFSCSIFIFSVFLCCPPLSSVSGTTCLVALLSDKELTVANVGDSRGVLCDKDGNAIPLSHDHKPYQLKERKRIKKAGEKIAGGQTNRLFSANSKEHNNALVQTLMNIKTHESIKCLLMIKAKHHYPFFHILCLCAQTDIKPQWLITQSASKAACYQMQPDSAQYLRCVCRHNSPSYPICINSVLRRVWQQFARLVSQCGHHKESPPSPSNGLNEYWTKKHWDLVAVNLFLLHAL